MALFRNVSGENVILTDGCYRKNGKQKSKCQKVFKSDRFARIRWNMYELKLANVQM